MNLLAILVLPLGCSQGDDAILLRGGRILVGDGREIEQGSVLISGGKIRAVGKDVEAPPGSRVLDVRGKTVTPGLIDANSAIGGQRNEDGSEVTPEVRILDSVEADDRELRRARQSGVTCLFVGPGNRNVIGGLGAVIRTSGKTRAEITLREDAALKAALGSGPSAGNFPPRGTQATFFARRPTTRMGVVWEFRNAFFEARRSESGSLASALAGKLPVRISASRATDIEEALRLAEEFKLAIILDEAQEAWKLAPLIATRKVPALLRPTLAPGVSGDGAEPRLDAFSLLAKAGVRVALLPAVDGDPDSLLTGAILAVKHGSSRADALRAITLGPAEILGVSDRVGSLDPGKDADLVVFSGDPLDATSRIELVLAGGRKVGGSAP